MKIYKIEKGIEAKKKWETRDDLVVLNGKDMEEVTRGK